MLRRFALLTLLSFLSVSQQAGTQATAQAAEPANTASEVRHRILCADSSKKRIAIINEEGKTEWESKIGPLHDLHLLKNGNVLFQKNWVEIVEVEPTTQKVVWEYNSAKSNGNEGKAIEVHAFQRLDDGNTLIAESGVSRLIEVDPAGKIVRKVALEVSKPHAHRDTRLVRKLANGNYLVCHEGDAVCVSTMHKARSFGNTPYRCLTSNQHRDTEWKPWQSVFCRAAIGKRQHIDLDGQRSRYHRSNARQEHCMAVATTRLAGHCSRVGNDITSSSIRQYCFGQLPRRRSQSTNRRDQS